QLAFFVVDRCDEIKPNVSACPKENRHPGFMAGLHGGLIPWPNAWIVFGVTFQQLEPIALIVDAIRFSYVISILQRCDHDQLCAKDFSRGSDISFLLISISNGNNPW